MITYKMTEYEWLQAFSENLLRLLHETNMSTRELAESANIAPSTITRWVKGLTTPNIRSIINISEVLNCPFEDLIYFGCMIE